MAAGPAGIVFRSAGTQKSSIFQRVACIAAGILEQVTMYAVFRSGGKQYRASKGETLKLEKLDADEGAKISFDEVLAGR